jgi:hypothetical protein
MLNQQSLAASFQRGWTLRLTNSSVSQRQWETTERGFVRKALLDQVKKDLGETNRRRNDLLHYGISGPGDTPGTAVITNEKYAHVKSRIRKTEVSAAMLDSLGTQLIIHMWKLAMIRGEIDINTILPDRLKFTEG